MPKATLLGHPAHPMLIAAPAALLPFSFVMDLLFRRTRRSAYKDAAYYALIGGVAGGAVAGATGAMDYMELPPGSAEKQVANVHAALNIGLIAASATNLALRVRGEDARSSLPFALGALGALGVLVSGWYGGHLVYEHGVRVKGRDVLEHAPEVRLPGDASMAQAMERQIHGLPSAALHVEPPEGPVH